MSRATDDLLDALHGTVACTLLDEIKRYRNGEVLDDKGNPQPIPASLIAQAIKFLKDNGIDRAVKPGDPEDLLADELEEEFNSNNVTHFPFSKPF
tara:strand:- start:6524 stop:6808 length:285 start_codon:yes stop_codon:yes gene_type:complete